MSAPLAVFGPKRWFLGITLAGLVMFLLATVGALLQGPPEGAGEGALLGRLALWGVVVVTPLFIADTARRLLGRLPTLVADEEGIRLRSVLGFTPAIRWDEIAAIEPVVISRKLWLAIALRDPAKSLGRWGTLMRIIHVRSHQEGAANITLRAAQLGANPVEAAGILEKLWRERSLAARKQEGASTAS